MVSLLSHCFVQLLPPKRGVWSLWRDASDPFRWSKGLAETAARTPAATGRKSLVFLRLDRRHSRFNSITSTRSLFPVFHRYRTAFDPRGRTAEGQMASATFLAISAAAIRHDGKSAAGRESANSFHAQFTIPGRSPAFSLKPAGRLPDPRRSTSSARLCRCGSRVALG